MIALTDNAISAVKRAIAKSGRDGAGFRIMIEAGGCAGFKYMIGLDSKPRDDDEVIETGGIRVFVDAKSKPMLDGVKVDFVEESGQAGFAFDNPNAAKKCDCGKSFC